jgi:sugar (pentulose or hexulose) kinase
MLYSVGQVCACTCAGYRPSSIAIAGGATRSPLWLSIHADVCNVPFVLTRQPEACLLGCAILVRACRREELRALRFRDA